MELVEEVPYGIAVEIEKQEEVDGRLVIHAVIWVDREGQKPIVIGAKGSRLKRIGQKAREEAQRAVWRAPASQSLGQGARGLGRRRALAGSARDGVSTVDAARTRQPRAGLSCCTIASTATPAASSMCSARVMAALRCSRAARAARNPSSRRCSCHSGRCWCRGPDAATRRSCHGAEPTTRLCDMAAVHTVMSGFYLNELIISLTTRHDPQTATVRRLRREHFAGWAWMARARSGAARCSRKRLLESIGLWARAPGGTRLSLPVSPPRRGLARGARGPPRAPTRAATCWHCARSRSTIAQFAGRGAAHVAPGAGSLSRRPRAADAQRWRDPSHDEVTS